MNWARIEHKLVCIDCDKIFFTVSRNYKNIKRCKPCQAIYIRKKNTEYVRNKRKRLSALDKKI